MRDLHGLSFLLAQFTHTIMKNKMLRKELKMFTTIFAMVVIGVVVAFSLHMASEIHDYMANDNLSEDIVVFN